MLRTKHRDGWGGGGGVEQLVKSEKEESWEDDGGMCETGLQKYIGLVTWAS